MAAILLIHGGWHGGWCWRRVAPRLRAAGHEVVTPMAVSFAPMLERVRGAPDWRTQVLATGHDAMLTEPEQVAELIGAVAAEVDAGAPGAVGSNGSLGSVGPPGGPLRGSGGA